MERKLRLALLGQRVSGTVATAFALATVPLTGQLSQDQALALAFPSAAIERRTTYLDDDQLEEARRLAGNRVEIESTILVHYVGLQDGAPIGVAYFDAHRVRTLQEVLMIVVGLDGRVDRVETVSFREPPDYEAPRRWLELFQGRTLTSDLSMRGDIPNVTGATLTTNAVTTSVRRVLALHNVVQPLGKPR